MPKWRKLRGSYYRKEGKQTVCYRAGSVIEATEEELRNVDQNLRTFEKVDDKTKTTGCTNGIKTKEEFLYFFEQRSKILHPELLCIGEMFSPADELDYRISKDGLLDEMKLRLQEAHRKAEYQNDVQPVDQRRKGGPLRSQEINEIEAQMEVIKKEIAYLSERLRPEIEDKAAQEEKRAEKLKKQKEKFAFHPAFRKDNVTPGILKRTTISRGKKSA